MTTFINNEINGFPKNYDARKFINILKYSTMPGLPINSSREAKDFSNEFNDYLKLKIKLNEKELSDQEEFFLTGEIAVAPLLDMRTLAEKIEDLQQQKVILLKAFLTITTPEEASAALSDMNPSLILFAVQNLKEIIEKVKKNFEIGIPSRILVDIIKELLNEFIKNKPLAIPTPVTTPVTTPPTTPRPTTPRPTTPTTPPTTTAPTTTAPTPKPKKISTTGFAADLSKLNKNQLIKAFVFDFDNNINNLKIELIDWIPTDMNDFINYPNVKYANSIFGRFKDYVLADESLQVKSLKLWVENQPDQSIFDQKYKTNIKINTLKSTLQPGIDILLNIPAKLPNVPIVTPASSQGTGLIQKKKDIRNGSKKIELTDFGKYQIDTNKLTNNLLVIKTKNGFNVTNYPTSEISTATKKIIKKILTNNQISYDDINDLNNDEHEFLFNLIYKAKLNNLIDFPTPKKDKNEVEINRFQILKGQILAGNDSKELLKEFKLLLVKLSNENKINQKLVRNILIDLAVLNI